VAVIQTGKVFTDLASIGNDHAHETHFDDSFVNHFYGGKQAVEVVSAFHQHLQLPTAQTGGHDETVGHLEVVMVSRAVVHI